MVEIIEGVAWSRFFNSQVIVYYKFFRLRFRSRFRFRFRVSLATPTGFKCKNTEGFPPSEALGDSQMIFFIFAFMLFAIFVEY